MNNHEARKNFMDEVLGHLTFEMALFRAVAGTENYSVLSNPDSNGKLYTEIEIHDFVDACEKKQIVPVLYISDGANIRVFSPKGKLAILSESYPNGFEC